jgi:hypothetical protein
MNKLIKKTSTELGKCAQKQKDVCSEKSYPHFAPSNGVCWKCNRNIYQNYEIDNRISDGETGEKFITGCPHCNRSYCD